MSRKVKTHPRSIAALIMALLLCVPMLSGCKPTDFFTEVIITPFSDVVDENNADHTVINSPDVQNESANLTALDWTDESPRSETVNNLVVYSSSPTTDLTAHHSVFDLDPLFPGIEASDGVRLVYDASSSLDHEAEADEQDEQVEAQSQSSGGQTQAQDLASQTLDGQTENSTPSPGQSTNPSGSGQVGDAPNGAADGNNKGDGENPDVKNPGQADDPYGGYNGTVAQYNPGDAFARVNPVDHLAAIGENAAVMAQAIGGPGALCATTEYALNGSDDPENRSISSLGYIFQNELGGCQTLWTGSGTAPGTLKDIDALVQACGQNGVILYDQRLGNQDTFFDKSQRQRLEAAGIQMVPVDFSSVEGIKDCARALKMAFANNPERAQRAQDYCDTVDNIVKAVANTRGGNIERGYGGDLWQGAPASTYTSMPGGIGYVANHTTLYIATDSSRGAVYRSTDGLDLDASKVLLFVNGDISRSPLAFWQQAAGVRHGSSIYGGDRSELALLWPIWNYGITNFPDTYSLSGGDGAMNSWKGAVSFFTVESAVAVSDMTHYKGFASKWMPYLVVMSDDVKNAFVASMADTVNDSTPATPYSAMSYSSVGNANAPGGMALGAGHVRSTLGATEGDQSPFYKPSPDKLALDTPVRVNPTGLLGDWTEGNMESVLETVWLTELYSHTETGCGYAAINNMGGFSLNIGGVTCTNTQQTVEAFYKHFYRLSDADARTCYEQVVTDKFEGLN